MEKHAALPVCSALSATLVFWEQIRGGIALAVRGELCSALGVEALWPDSLPTLPALLAVAAPPSWMARHLEGEGRRFNRVPHHPCD